MDRRTFLRGAAASAAVILTPGLLMPVREIISTPPLTLNMIRALARHAKEHAVQPDEFGNYAGPFAGRSMVSILGLAELQREVNQRRTLMIRDIDFYAGSQWRR